MEVIKLIGVLIVIVGFIFKARHARRCCCGRSGNRTCSRHEPYEDS